MKVGDMVRHRDDGSIWLIIEMKHGCVYAMKGHRIIFRDPALFIEVINESR